MHWFAIAVLQLYWQIYWIEFWHWVGLQHESRNHPQWYCLTSHLLYIWVGMYSAVIWTISVQVTNIVMKSRMGDILIASCVIAPSYKSGACPFWRLLFLWQYCKVIYEHSKRWGTFQSRAAKRVSWGLMQEQTLLYIVSAERLAGWHLVPL